MLQARGSAWTGSARLALTGGPGSTDSAVLPGVLEWRVRPHWSGLAAQIKAQCCTTQALRLDIRPHWGGATLLIADAATQWPAQVLSGLGTPWNTVQPEGDLALSTRGLSVEWNAGRVTVLGHAQLDALNIASRLSTLRPMGSYRITINGAATSTLQLETLDGSLQLTGSGQWVGARLRFNGIASAAPERAAALANLLNIIGRRSGSKSIITL